MRVLQISILLIIFLITSNNVIAQKQTEKYSIVNGVVKYGKLLGSKGQIFLNEKIVTNAQVKFIDENGIEYLTEANDKGEYKLFLPKGKYYAVAFIPNNYVLAKYDSGKILFEVKAIKKYKLNFEIYAESCG